jgi:hypothetical protein
MYMLKSIYIYIYRERERERERHTHTHTYTRDMNKLTSRTNEPGE